MARIGRQAGTRKISALLRVTLLIVLAGLLFLVGPGRLTPGCHCTTEASGQAAAGSSQQQSGPLSAATRDDTQRIPRILHRVFLAGRENFDALHDNVGSSIKAEWDDWCQLVHGPSVGWTYRFWDNTTVHKLLEEDYPWFLPTYEKYKTRVARGDAIRPFIMHKYGGVYLDMDSECFREGYDMLEGADVVLQGTIVGENVTNAVMASAPGHPYWEEVFKVLEKYVDKADNPTFATGPGPMATALTGLGLLNPPWPKDEKEGGPEWWRWQGGGDYSWKGTVMRIYPLGQWYTPCWFSHDQCHRQQEERKKEGLLALQPLVVGYHKYSGTWWDAKLRPGKENDPAHQAEQR